MSEWSGPSEGPSLPGPEEEPVCGPEVWPSLFFTETGSVGK